MPFLVKLIRSTAIFSRDGCFFDMSSYVLLYKINECYEINLIKVNLFIGKENRNKIDELIWVYRDPMSFIDLTFTIWV